MKVAYLTAALILAACTSAANRPTTQMVPPKPTTTTFTATPSTAIIISPTPSRDSMSLTPTPTRNPYPLTATPQAPTRISQPITPQNAASLGVADQIQFSPWELVLAIACSPDGGTLAVVAGETIHIYDVGTFKERLTLSAGVWNPGIDFSPDNRTMVTSGRDGLVRFWDVATGKAIFSIPAHKKGANAVTFSPNGELVASAGNDGMVRLWDSATGKLHGEMIGGAYGIPALAFTSDGLDLAIANGSVIRFRQVDSGRFSQTLRGESSFYGLAIAPDGQTLAAGDSENTLWLWNIPGGEVRFKQPGPKVEGPRSAALIWRVAFSPDGGLLASAGGDHKVRLWDVRSGELLTTLNNHTAAVTSLAFSPDGRWLVTGGLDARVIRWRPGF